MMASERVVPVLRGMKKLALATVLLLNGTVANSEESDSWLMSSIDGLKTSVGAPVDMSRRAYQWAVGSLADESNSRETEYGDNVEQTQTTMKGGQSWVKADEDESRGDRLEIQQVTAEDVTTVKLQNIVPPIHFASGKAEIPEKYIDQVREVLQKMEGRKNLRLHFVGHTDNASLSKELAQLYVDNIGLSRERAGTTAEYFQRALHLPAESISYEGLGDSVPVASNNSEAGRAKNRRVEVEVWYDEVAQKQIEKEVLVSEQMHRIKVCRVETVCKLTYKTDHDKRAKVKNLVAPLRYSENATEVSGQFLQQIRQVLDNLSIKQNVVVRFIGHTDNLPLGARDARIYGNHLSLSRARARRVALAVQDALDLPTAAIDSDGMGAEKPLASNDTEKGRSLNRRIEVEFWYDDPLQALPDEPQMCPEQSGAETVTAVYDPPSGPVAPVYFKDGQPLVNPGYSQRLRQLMAEIGDKTNVRLRFTGYIANERLDRRTAAVYGDDVGLSTARARRVMEQVAKDIALTDEQTEVLGYGYVQTDDVVNAGFVESDRSRVKVEVIYDELALLEDFEGIDITRITREVETRNPYALNLMRITVDGEPLVDPGKSIADVQRCTDVAFEKADIRFKFDNLNFKPRLNITAWPSTVRYQDDYNTSAIENKVSFKLYSNYRNTIEKAEVRLFNAGESTRSEPLAVVPLNADGNGEWQVEFDNATATVRKLVYLLRVYDSEGRFDQTQPQTLWVVDEVDTAEPAQSDADRELLTGYGENRLAEQNIPLNGGSVQVFGDSIPENHSVWVAGRPVPLSQDNEFITEELLPSGLHTVEVAVLDEEGNGELYLRDLQLKKNDWFYVGIADLTLARDDTNGPAALVTNDEAHYDNDVSIDGRFAFFTNGKFGDNWELTASADTREGEIDEIFTNFMEKTPDAMFRRIDPDYYYPTFGDDSTVEEGAPTLGKFYVKLAQDDNYGLWGNFDAEYTNNSLAHIDRTLYGANLHWQDKSVTGFGDQRWVVDGFVADPGTIASRDEFRGTGGSVYYLRHQDILQGSERVRVEVRDKDSGLVVAVKNLQAGLDYDMEYIQGRVFLSEPLSATNIDQMLINSDTGNGSEVYLVTRYEYTPGLDEADTLAVGAQAHYWVNDSVRLGLTTNSSEEDSADGSLNGVDVTWRKSTDSWIKLELSQSEGAGVDTLDSIDGGFTFDPVSVTDEDASAGGVRLDSSLALSDLHDTLNGKMTFYVQTLEAGYAAPGLQTSRDLDQFGGMLTVPVTERMDLRAKLDIREQDEGLETTATEVNADYRLGENWTLSSGLRYDDRTDNSVVVPATQEVGDRTDMRIQGKYDSRKNWSSYGFLQGTLASTGNRDENNRIGAGGSYQLSERLSVNGEVSGGDLGTLGSLGTEFLYSDRTSLYTNYVIENERTDNGLRSRQGNLVSGFRTQYKDTASLYMEERYSHGDAPSGLTHSAGIDLAPNDRWNYGINIDIATLKDSLTAAETERTAMGLKLGYRFEATTYASALEYRIDDNESPSTGETSERKTWLMKNSVKLQVSDNWRFIGKLNLSESESSQGEFYDGNFTEAVLGYAYRPVYHDRLNALLKYTYFYNLPATDQVTVANTAVEYVQKSHVISADVTFDLTSRLSLGGKYAFRRGELSLDREDPEFFRSDAFLYVARADWHLPYRWDLLLEGRMLDLPDAQDKRSGLLVGVYRHVGDNLKIGVGYNATDFSDDLTDLDYDSKGYFINAIGKF